RARGRQRRWCPCRPVRDLWRHRLSLLALRARHALVAARGRGEEDHRRSRRHLGAARSGHVARRRCRRHRRLRRRRDRPGAGGGVRRLPGERRPVDTPFRWHGGRRRRRRTHVVRRRRLHQGRARRPDREPVMSRDVTVFSDGYSFLECPRWHDGRLYVSDFYTYRVLSLDAEGRATTVVEVPNQPSGLGWLPDGRMVIVSMRDKKLLRRELSGELVEHAALESLVGGYLNDMVVDAKGRAYVGNFGF